MFCRTMIAQILFGRRSHEFLVGQKLHKKLGHPKVEHMFFGRTMDAPTLG